METLKIAFVADRVAPFYPGGYERHLATLAEAIAAQHSVTVFSAVPGRPATSSGVRYVQVSPAWSYTRARGGHSLRQASVYAASVAVRLPRMVSYDFVDVLGIPYVQMAPVQVRARWEGWRWGVTIWEAWHEYAYLDGAFARPSIAAFRAAMRTATWGEHPVLVGSTRTARALQALYHVDPRRIQWSPPGVRFPRTEAGPGSEGPDVVFIGRLEPYKRVDDLLRALGRLRATGRSVRAEVVGVGSARAELGQVAQREGVADRVSFRGYLGETEKEALLRAAKLFVMPSEREGFSIATLEAIAAGACPLVARPAQDEQFGAGDLIAGSEEELSFPVGDSAVLASRIELLLSDGARRTALAGAVRARARRYDLDRVVGEYLRMVREGPAGMAG